jgi:mono/diheme cytochrome c family protein
MKRSGAGLALLLLLAACGREEPPPPTLVPLSPADRPFSMESLMRGARLYQEQCSQCHGPDAQGHPDWQNPQVNAAPPLDGTGNEWKRSKADLVNVILNGAARDGVPVMPAWKGRLTQQEAEDIVAWFQALWPADVYEKWQKANAAAAAPRG